MSYGKVLQNMIKKEEISFKELAKRCKDYGKSIDPSYISKLVNGKIAAPSDEISKVIAKVLNEDEETLILEASLEKTPNIILKFIKKIRLSTMLPILERMKSTLSDSQLEDFINYLSNSPISEFILEVNNSNFNQFQSRTGKKMIIKDDESSISISLNQPMGIPITDNSMEPKIPKGSTISFKTGININNGDIIGFIPENEHQIKIRKYYKKGNNIILTPENTSFEPLVYNDSNITIVGKVDKYIVKL